MKLIKILALFSIVTLREQTPEDSKEASRGKFSQQFLTNSVHFYYECALDMRYCTASTDRRSFIETDK